MKKGASRGGVIELRHDLGRGPGGAFAERDAAVVVVHRAQELFEHLGGEDSVAGLAELLPGRADDGHVCEGDVAHGHRFGNPEGLFDGLATRVGVACFAVCEGVEAQVRVDALVEVEAVAAGVED